MSADSPVAILYSTDGYQVAVTPGAAIASNPRSIPVAGTDGSNSRTILTSSTGAVRVDPTGTTTQPVSGTVTANQGGTWTVQPGNTANTTPWLITISQGGNAAAVTASNALKIDGSAVTQPVSGTVTVTQATAANLRSQTASESATGSAVPSIAGLAGGSVTTAAPTYTTGNLGALSLTTSGLLRVDGSGVTQPVSGTVTANAGTGNFTVVQATASSLNATVIGTGTDNTSNSTAKLPVIAAKANTSAPTWTDGNMVPLSVDTSGALRITGTISASNSSIGSNGAAIPTSSTQIGGSDGTNLQAARVFDADTGVGTQYILGVGLRKSASGGSVELGTASDPIRTDPTGTTTQPVSGTITANIGTSGSLALDATLAKLTIAQSTALGSNTQALMGGSVTTAAPTYTTGNINPLSLTTAGALRVDGSAVTQPVSGTVTANAGTGSFTVVQATASNLKAQTASESATGSATPSIAGLSAGAVTTAAPSYTTGNLGALSLTTSGLLRVDGSGVTQPISGTVTANAGTGNFTVVQATASNLNATVIGTGADNTTNSTAKLPVIVAKANTSAPTWTDGNMAPLSVDTSGALRVTGTISATNASVGTNNAATPSSSSQIGGSDGTNLQAVRVFDADTGAGTQYILGVGLRKSASGGSVELGTSTDPIRTDPTGTTTQPISGTVTVTQATAANLKAQTASESATGSAVPATAGLAGGSVTTAAPTYTNGNLGALSLTTSGLLRVDGSGATQPVSGTVTANIGTSGSLALDATVSTLSGKFASSGALADGASNPTSTTVGSANLLFNGTTFDRARSGQVGVQTSVVGFQNMIPVGRYNATRLILSDTNYANLQMDGQGNTWTRDGYQPVAEDNVNGVIANQTLPLVSTTYAYTTAQGVGALPGNIKAAAGNVYSLYVYNGNTSNRFIQLFNSAGAPTGTPLMSIMVPGGGSITMGTDFFGPGGFNFSTGISLGFSTAQTTYTAGTAGDCNYVIGYK